MKVVVKNNLLLFTFVAFFIIKIIIFIALKSDFLSVKLGGGNDAEYYHGYAVGRYDFAVSTWPIILRYLNNLGLYSREFISQIFLVLNLIFIPFLTANVSSISLKYQQKMFLYIILLCSIYPTIFIFTFDVYRDVFMLFSFLLGTLIVKKFLDSSGVVNFVILFLLSFSMGLFLLGLRPYLGYAFIISLFLWKIKFTKKRLVLFGILYFSVLFIANYAGLLDVLIEYRSGFEEGGGGSTLGLNFSNPLLFIPNFILSFLGQMFGLYITNPLAVILFLIETVPIFFMLIYIIKNIKLADSFVRFLIIFFMLYASVWLIGNDNLGTAVRLRIYNYFAIYISFFYILRLKSNNLKNLKAIK